VQCFVQRISTKIGISTKLVRALEIFGCYFFIKAEIDWAQILIFNGKYGNPSLRKIRVENV